MAVTYPTKVFSVFGDQRVATGLITMTDGATSFNVGGFTTVNTYMFQPCSGSAGLTKLAAKGTSNGYIYIASCSSGDTFHFLVMGK